MIYILVLFGSFFGICALLGVRVAMRNRSVRKFVRSIRQRTDSVADPKVLVGETQIVKPKKNPRTSAIEMQQVRTLVRQAEKALAQDKHNDVERLLIQALTIDPLATDVRAELAKLYLTTNREAKAEAMYKELLRTTKDVSYHSNLGLAYYRQEKFEDACFAYQEALNLDSKNPERSAALGRACIAARRFKEAAPLLEKASERLARDTTLMHLLAECYMQLGLNDRAEEVYRRIHKLQPYDEQVKEKLSSLARV